MLNDPSIVAAQNHPEWMAVLRAYSDQAKVPANDGWNGRLNEIEGVPKDQLSAIHGKLIAFGYLKFELQGRDSGIRYQLSTAGQQALSGLPAIVTGDDAHEEAA